jgi:hypothetical protein
MESRTAERNRLLKLLETANIKLASVVTDVFGVSGRLMLDALIEGTATPATMAALAKGVLRKKTRDLEHALEACRGAPSLLVGLAASAPGPGRRQSRCGKVIERATDAQLPARTSRCNAA